MSEIEKIWFAAEITVISSAAEAVEFAFNEMGSLGTEINNLGKNSTGTLTVVGYFTEPPDDEIFGYQLSEALRIYGFSSEAVTSVGWRRFGDADWLFEWKKFWQPTKIGRFIVAPTWYSGKVSAENGETVIWLDPNMAFGTGTHQTTQLCLRAIEKNFRAGMSFLDVGTGTGILAIAASKSGVQSPKPGIVGCDTDENSIKIAQENAAINDVSDIEFYVGSITNETPEFDFICANLTADALLPLLPLLLEKTKRNLVLSGILREQEKLITDELKKFQISNLKIETDEEWISIEARNEK